MVVVTLGRVVVEWSSSANEGQSIWLFCRLTVTVYSATGRLNSGWVQVMVTDVAVGDGVEITGGKLPMQNKLCIII